MTGEYTGQFHSSTGHLPVSRLITVLDPDLKDKTWKLLDYASSNGVKMNKVKLKPHQYVRCTVGSVLDIGLSTRKYLMNGPAEDQLDESKESGFELREMFKKKQRKLEKEMLGEEDSDEEETKKDSEEGINWGFTEDAWEDKDDDDDFTPDPTKKASFIKVRSILKLFLSLWAATLEPVNI